MVPNVLGSREGWELCIVTDGVTVGMSLGEGSFTQERYRWWAVVNTVMKLRVLHSVRNLLTSWGTTSFSRRTLLHGVNQCQRQNSMSERQSMHHTQRSGRGLFQCTHAVPILFQIDLRKPRNICRSYQLSSWHSNLQPAECKVKGPTVRRRCWSKHLHLTGCDGILTEKR
jgi:hypothetical protein